MPGRPTERPKRPETALILAAHGSSHHPEAAEAARRMAESFVRAGHFDEALGAFVKDAPRLAEVLDLLSAPDVTVVPLLTSAGYFTRTVLPREMGLTVPVTRRAGRLIRLTEPVGEHPWMAKLLRRRVEDMVRHYGLDPNETAVAVVGHGTRHNPTSAAATLRHTETLRRTGSVREVVAVFLDQSPEIEWVIDLIQKRNLVVLPFLIGHAGHERIDIPARLGILPRGDTHDLWTDNPHEVHGRHFYLAPPIGDDPGLFDIVLDLARAAGARLGLEKRGEARGEMGGMGIMGTMGRMGERVEPERWERALFPGISPEDQEN